MYAINTFLRIVRFATNSLIGLVVGFLLGTQFDSFSSLLEFIRSALNL